jgi:hypothetical protein
MSDPRIIGEFTDMAGLLGILRQRRDELNLAGEDIDEVAGLPVRYCQKIIGIRPVRGVTALTLGPLLSVLGIKCLVVENPETIAKYLPRMKQRRADCVRHTQSPPLGAL